MARSARLALHHINLNQEELTVLGRISDLYILRLPLTCRWCFPSRSDNTVDVYESTDSPFDSPNPQPVHSAILALLGIRWGGSALTPDTNKLAAVFKLEDGDAGGGKIMHSDIKFAGRGVLFEGLAKEGLGVVSHAEDHRRKRAENVGVVLGKA